MIKPWKLILLLAGIFIAGGVTGAFVMVRAGKEMLRQRPGPQDWAPNHMKRLVERLGLNPEQTEQIRPVVKRNMEELSRLRNETMAETKGVFERMEREISEKLTPEQREKFDKLNKEMRERARKVMSDRQKGSPGQGGTKGDRERSPGEPGKPPGDQPPPDKPPGG
jgi:uncharacterized membrane protein